MRRKVRYTFTIFISVSLVFIIYQLIMLVELSNLPDNLKLQVKHNLLLGTHEQQESFYKPDSKNHFRCIGSLEEISFNKVNDDYCDCLDGSDEPGTNACANGKFFCRTQSKAKGFPNSVHSMKVNDGICDCCDGSDEWKNLQLIKGFNAYSDKKAHRYHPPCPYKC